MMIFFVVVAQIDLSFVYSNLKYLVWSVNDFDTTHEDCVDTIVR